QAPAGDGTREAGEDERRRLGAGEQRAGGRTGMEGAQGAVRGVRGGAQVVAQVGKSGGEIARRRVAIMRRFGEAAIDDLLQLSSWALAGVRKRRRVFADVRRARFR